MAFNILNNIHFNIISEHLRSIDFNARNLLFVEKINKEDLEEILDILNGILEI